MMGRRTLAPHGTWDAIRPLSRSRAAACENRSARRDQAVAKAGDPRLALEQAFRDESALLLRWLTKKLGDADSAQDVLQSVYLRILSFSADNHIDNPKALIFRTAANLALNEMKRRNRFNVRHVATSPDSDIDPIANIQNGAPTLEEALLTREAIEAAATVVNALPDKARRAFLLNRVDGKTYREIAEILGVSQSSVEKYIIRALGDLRSVQRAHDDAPQTDPGRRNGLSDDGEGDSIT